MFKKLLINKDYEISLSGECRCLSSDSLVISDDKLGVVLNGKLKWLCKKWLGLIAHFEVDVPLSDLMKITFIENKSKLLRFKCGMQMVFKRPIYYREGFRVVPNLTRYAVSEIGEVVSIFSDKFIAIGKGPNGYPVVTVYDPDKNCYRDIGLHILVARAWVKNPFPESYFVVNHKNGNKRNYHFSNLEWTNGSENNIHARNIGLKKDNKPCLVYDNLTQKLTSFMSISDATNWMGFKRSTVFDRKTVNGNIVPLLHKGRYVLLREDSPFTIDEIKSFDFSQRNTGPYEALNIDTKEIIESDSTVKLAKLCKLNKKAVQDNLLKGDNVAIKRFLIRKKSDDPWPTVLLFSNKQPNISILARNIITEEAIDFPSLRSAYQYFECDKTTIAKRLNTNKPFNGWVFNLK